jgi:hypothetical protein
MLNLFKTSNSIKHIKPTRNAVIIEFANSSSKPIVHTECKDYEMEYFLVLKAREILGALS